MECTAAVDQITAKYYILYIISGEFKEFICMPTIRSSVMYLYSFLWLMVAVSLNYRVVNSLLA